MNKEKMYYIKKGNSNAKVIRTEILLTPVLIIFPLIISILLIYDWYVRGFSVNNPAFNGELLLGIIILIGNISFDIPLVKTLKTIKKQKDYFTNLEP